MNTPIRILVADDHPIVRDGLISILGTQPDFDVVGKAGDGRETLEQVETLQPDVLLLDLEMPHMDGVETLRHLRDVHAAVRSRCRRPERLRSLVRTRLHCDRATDRGACSRHFWATQRWHGLRLDFRLASTGCGPRGLVGRCGSRHVRRLRAGLSGCGRHRHRGRVAEHGVAARSASAHGCRLKARAGEGSSHAGLH